MEKRDKKGTKRIIAWVFLHKFLELQRQSPRVHLRSLPAGRARNQRSKFPRDHRTLYLWPTNCARLHPSFWWTRSGPWNSRTCDSLRIMINVLFRRLSTPVAITPDEIEIRKAPIRDYAQTFVAPQFEQRFLRPTLVSLYPQNTLPDSWQIAQVKDVMEFRRSRQHFNLGSLPQYPGQRY